MDVPDGLAQRGLESLIELCGFGVGVFCLIGAVAAAQRKDWSEFRLTAVVGFALTWFFYTFGSALRSIVDYQLHK